VTKGKLRIKEQERREIVRRFLGWAWSGGVLFALHAGLLTEGFLEQWFLPLHLALVSMAGALGWVALEQKRIPALLAFWGGSLAITVILSLAVDLSLTGASFKADGPNSSVLFLVGFCGVWAMVLLWGGRLSRGGCPCELNDRLALR